MIDAVCRGGPNNGIKVTASAQWDGKIAKPNKNVNKGIYESRKFYHGRYHLRTDSGKPYWLWVPERIQPKRKGTLKPEKL